MTLNELRYIVAVARERHFGRAAEACHVSQPTLSVAVRKLEEELGVSLFERRKGDISITPIGEQIVSQAQRVLEEVAGLRQIALQGRDQLAGRPAAPGGHLHHRALPAPAPDPAACRDRSPDAAGSRGELHSGVVREAQAGRPGHHCHLPIVISLPLDEPGIRTLPLYEEPFTLLIPSSHPFNQQEEVSIEQLSRENVLLLGSGHCFRDQVLEVCPDCLGKSADGRPRQALESSSLETIRYMVASGLGVTVLPCTATGAERFSERLVQIRRFAGTPPSRTVALAWRKSFPRPEAVNAVREAILSAPLSCTRPVDMSRLPTMS